MFTLDLNKFCKEDFSAITLTIYFTVMYLDCRHYTYYRPISVYHRNTSNARNKFKLHEKQRKRKRDNTNTYNVRIKHKTTKETQNSINIGIGIDIHNDEI